MQFLVFQSAMDYDYDYDYEEPDVAVVPSQQPIVERYKDTDVQMVWDHCIQPSIASVIPNIADLIMYNLLFNILTQTGEGYTTKRKTTNTNIIILQGKLKKH